MNEVGIIQDVLDAAPKGKEYKADWDANRENAHKHLHKHLLEASFSLGAAFNGLTLSQRWPTRDEQADADGKRRDEQAGAHSTLLLELLNAEQDELERLQAFLVAAEARAVAGEAVATNGSQQQSKNDDKLARRVRRIVMGAVHRNSAANAAEGGMAHPPRSDSSSRNRPRYRSEPESMRVLIERRLSLAEPTSAPWPHELDLLTVQIDSARLDLTKFGQDMQKLEGHLCWQPWLALAVVVADLAAMKLTTP